MNRIKDIDEFCKLYKINIPINEEFDYYISTLLKSKEYSESNFEKKFKDFAELESLVEKNQLPSVSKLKMLFLDTLSEYIKSTSAYNLLLESEIPKKQLNTKDWTSMVQPSDVLMSIDFKSANYSVLKTFDNNGELKGSWRELCEFLLVPEGLIESKSFRQIVFGNTNPKRLQTFQHINMTSIKEALMLLGNREEGVEFLSDENNYVFVSHDEIIIKINSVKSTQRVIEFLNFLVTHGNMQTKCTFFTLNKVKKNLYVKTMFELKGDVMEEIYKTLHGAPGNKFYMLFKEHILNEPYDERDLLYINDGELSKWAVEKPKGLPHYPKPKIVLSTEDAIHQFPRIWDKLSELIPNLKNEEKRRIVEIVANTCKSCWGMETGCNCHRDE